MEELISKIRNINSMLELDDSENIDSNSLFLAIIEAERYDLLNNCNIKLNISNDEVSMRLIEFLVTDEDVSYYIYRNNYFFSKEDIKNIFKIVCQKYQDDYKFNNFFRYLFNSGEELDNFIKENENFFINYLRQKNDSSVAYSLIESNSFIKLILKEKRIKLIKNIEDYSVSNLKLLVPILKSGTELPYFLGNDRFMRHLFQLKSELEPSEFYELLTLLKEKDNYYRIGRRGGKLEDFSKLVDDNIDYLINLVSQVGNLPKCLVESEVFRDECIKRNKIDLAVKCLLPRNIFQDSDLVNKYCDELDIDVKDFYARGKWILDYYERNNNIFNSFVATSLKDDIFNLGEEHIERFINDISIQMKLEKLNDKENSLLSKILKKYNYEDYDISFMITNILLNIKDYSDLINSLDLSSITEEELRILISIMQLSKNPYSIITINDLKNYRNKKKEFLENNYSSNDIDFNKDNLLKLLFNIDLVEGMFINKYYCYDKYKNVLEELSNSELSKNIFEYLILINKIVESQSFDEILNLYNQYKDNDIYNIEIPFETYLRSEYTKLYSDSLFKIEEKENVYGPQDSIYRKVNYNDKEIKVCIPREKLNFMVHVVGSCSHAENKIDYQKDWEDRPQMQDHFVACSYINEYGIYSIRTGGTIILGFDFLESGSLLGMGDTDIDSINVYARKYNCSKGLIELNGNRAHYFVPSLLLKSIHDGYNEIVIERRNCCGSDKKHFKRVPNYIIMITDTLEENNFYLLDDLYTKELSFINEEDKQKIVKARIGKDEDIKSVLIKYKDEIIKEATLMNIKANELLKYYVSLIMKAKYFEDNLKASSEFGVPLVVIDKLYYFNKILSESSMYDEETKNSISMIYLSADEYTKGQVFNHVAQGKELTNFLEKTHSNRISIKM